MSNIEKSKIIVILGPTASGKTKLGVDLARKFNGEIISADSRQVYRGMDIGTGKDLAEYGVGKNKVPYHLIDVADPKQEFNVVQYQQLAHKAIEDIIKKGKLPIIVGGTGLYLQALVDNYQLSSATPDKKSRDILENKTVEEVFKLLEKTNPIFAGRLNESEKKNKRRLIRYLEVVKNPAKKVAEKKVDSNRDFLILGLNFPREILNKRIYERIIRRIETEGMIQEVERLHDEDVSWKRLEGFGLEYKFISFYLQEKIEKEEMIEKLFIASRQFAKRQMTWFRRWEKQGREINWVKDEKATEKLVNNFLK